jgi:hypothetical protein
MYSGYKDGRWSFFTDNTGADPYIEIPTDQYMAFIDRANNTGKIIQWNEETGEPFLVDPPPPTAAEAAEQRIAEIDQELTELDGKKARPTASITLAMAEGAAVNSRDAARLQQYEQQAEALRIERSELLERLNDDPQQDPEPELEPTAEPEPYVLNENDT